MNRALALVVAALLALALVGCSTAPETQAAADAPTYFHDVQPILDAKCNYCHVEGGFAPFALTNPDQARTVAASIKAQVVARTMPPWMPDDSCRAYQGKASLEDDQIDTLSRWADAGAPLGDPADVGVPITGQPDGLERIDVSLTMPTTFQQTEVPDQLRCFVMDWPVDHETFITGFDAVPGEPRVVHHMSVWIAGPGTADAIKRLEDEDSDPGYDCFSGARVNAFEVASWIPGVRGYNFAKDTGYRVVPGSKVVVQMHYNADVRGPAPDRSTLLFKTDDHVSRPATLHHFNGEHWPRDLLIPAMSADTKVAESFDLGNTGTIEAYWINVHMHYLGSIGKMWLTHANGDRECLLEIPAWNFHWQQSYMPIDPPKIGPGDKVELECQWDNTPTHQPTIDGLVRTPADTTWGAHSTNEMCIGSLYTVDD